VLLLCIILVLIHRVLLKQKPEMQNIFLKIQQCWKTCGSSQNWTETQQEFNNKSRVSSLSVFLSGCNSCGIVDNITDKCTSVTACCSVQIKDMLCNPFFSFDVFYIFYIFFLWFRSDRLAEDLLSNKHVQNFTIKLSLIAIFSRIHSSSTYTLHIDHFILKTSMFKDRCSSGCWQ